MPTIPKSGHTAAGPFRETAHRVHDYGHLVRRWRAIARGAGLKLEEFARQDEYPVYCVRTPGDPAAGGLYVSSGIHGDEPAGPEALTRWAERRLAAHVRAREAVPLFIAPCLNPWGLVNNHRADHRGRDLNRLFDRNISPMRELRRLLQGRRFDLSLHHHEDYDAQGMYLYEITTNPPPWGGELLAACASRGVPVETRRRIDGFKFRAGLLAQPIRVEDAPGCPEALYLYLRHTSRACTFETPSEFGLAHRVRAHVLLIEACLQRLQLLKQLTTKIDIKGNKPGKQSRRVAPAPRHG